MWCIIVGLFGGGVLFHLVALTVVMSKYVVAWNKYKTLIAIILSIYLLITCTPRVIDFCKFVDFDNTKQAITGGSIIVYFLSKALFGGIGLWAGKFIED